MNLRPIIATLLVVSGLVSGCGQKDAPPPLHELREAYSLMDKGENNKAVILLERYLEREPNSSEGRLLLASAYLGVAGVDIYRAYETFRDILFNRSLADNTWGNIPSPTDYTARPAPTTTAMESIIDTLDLILAKLKQTVMFLNRFPDVPREKWPLLDRALENLLQLDATRDVALYRIFLRIVYVRAYVNVEIIKDAEIGSRKWACQIEFLGLRNSLQWLAKHFLGAAVDLHEVYPNESSQFEVAEKGITKITNILSQGLPVGTNTGLFAAQEQMRETLKCGSFAQP